MKLRCLAACLGTLLIVTPAPGFADAVPFSDYKLLSRGMSEAEVLYRVGPPDHETAVTDNYHHVLRKTWYYIPRKDQPHSKRWVSEISFDARGHISSLRRYRP